MLTFQALSRATVYEILDKLGGKSTKLATEMRPLTSSTPDGSSFNSIDEPFVTNVFKSTRWGFPNRVNSVPVSEGGTLVSGSGQNKKAPKPSLGAFSLFR
jgi:hypothetical protein